MILCVTSVNYSIHVNKDVVSLIVPFRGLWQGDPLSLYLFILCNDGLSALIKYVELCGDLHGCLISRGAPRVSYLLFVDDNFFFQAKMSECVVMKNILS